jgi:NADH:ubiquinone oxidoreductase subunit E
MQQEGCCCQGKNNEKELYTQLDSVLDQYKEKKGALIPILQIAQNLFGYLPEKALSMIARGLNKSYSEVTGVVSFYSFFSTVPRGKYLIRVCLGTACYVRGAKEVLKALNEELGIDVGQTTADKMFSLEVGRCFGACGLAPVIMVNDDTHQRVKPACINEILNLYRKKAISQEGGN